MVLGIDLGSNTLRACVMSGDFEILNEAEFIVGSARGLKKGGNLQNDAKERIMQGLKNLQSVFDFSMPNVCVATEAFRMANDSENFFTQIKQEFGLKFQIIDGESEAKLVRKGIEKRLQILGILDENSLFIDLGGGSTEISYKEIYKSFKFGIVRFANEKAKNLSSRADEITAEAREFINKFNVKNIILSSGVPTTVSALKMGMNYLDYKKEMINGTSLNLSDFVEILDQIKAMSKEESDVKLGENRVDLMICGIYLLLSLLKNCNCNFIVVDDGLREGLCINYIENMV